MEEDITIHGTNFKLLFLNDLLMSAPKLDVQMTLVLIHTMLWYLLINFVFYPIGVRVISI